MLNKFELYAFVPVDVKYVKDAIIGKIYPEIEGSKMDLRLMYFNLSVYHKKAYAIFFVFRL